MKRRIEMSEYITVMLCEKLKPKYKAYSNKDNFILVEGDNAYEALGKLLVRNAKRWKVEIIHCRGIEVTMDELQQIHNKKSKAHKVPSRGRGILS